MLVSTAATVVIVAGLKAAAPLLVPLLFAVLLAIIAVPALIWLQRHRVPPSLAIFPVIAVMLGAFALFGMLLNASLGHFADAVPLYRTALEQKFSTWIEFLSQHGVALPLPGDIDLFAPAQLVDLVGTVATAMVGALSNTALVLLLVLFMLLEVVGFRGKLQAALGRPDAEFPAAQRILTDVQRYLAIKTAISGLTGVLVTLSAWIIGLDFPVLWGMLAFLFNYIPNVGSFLAAVPALLVALVQPDLGAGGTLGMAVAFVVINTVVGNVLEPAWMGRKLGMSALVVLLCLVFWGWLWGPVGMLLSVPLTMAAKIAFENTEHMRWLAVLLGPATPVATEPRPAP